MYDITQFREFIIKAPLTQIELYSPEAEELLVATCAHESLGGTYVCQQGGPALGVFQMEPDTYKSLWTISIPKKQHLPVRILTACNYRMQPPATAMMYNLQYAAMMARAYYLQFTEALPAADDIDAIWAYYKKYWNTEKGSATKEQFVSNYYKFTGKGKPKAKAA